MTRSWVGIDVNWVVYVNKLFVRKSSLALSANEMSAKDERRVQYLPLRSGKR
jgi:hypothetical protein